MQDLTPCSSTGKINYSPEIDGLRAIAVLSVIIFHAGAEQVSGGFVGVDIFYVISGYLITKIILVALEKDKFTFSEFYVRRIKRLLPAALFMVVTVVAFGVVILTPDKYVELSKSAICSNLFMANVWFMNNSGYFDLSAEISPLVHMWSLSVEEQFYLLFPFMLFISYRISGIKGIKFFIFSILTISFILSVTLSRHFPNFSFYMLPTRAWELGFGASLTILPSLKSNNKSLASAISLAGMALIIYGFIYITHNDIYPGHLALFPVMGTTLVIYSLASNNTVVKTALTLRPLLFLGKISYSAYLWHWPIIVYYRIYINQQGFDIYELLSLILISIFAGYLSWRYIEERYRYKKYSNSKVYTISLCATIFAISLPGVVYFLEGLPVRISESEIAITDENLMWEWPCTERRQIFPEIPTKYCVIGAPWENASKKGMVWGDSHSQHWAQLLHYEALNKNISLVIAPLGCPPYLNSMYVKEHYPEFHNFTEVCTLRNSLSLKWLKDNETVSIVIMAAAWSGHARMLYTDEQLANKSNSSLSEKDADVGASLSEPAFRQLLLDLGDKEILILGDIPRPNKILNDCAISEISNLIRSNCDDSIYKHLNSKSVLSWHRSSNRVLISMADEFENIRTIIPSDSLCDSKSCQTYINNELIYKDGNHIRRNLSSDTAKLFSEKIGLHEYFSSILRN